MIRLFSPPLPLATIRVLVPTTGDVDGSCPCSCGDACIECVSIPLVRPWCECQKELRSQLCAGVRYLDVRLGYAPAIAIAGAGFYCCTWPVSGGHCTKPKDGHAGGGCCVFSGSEEHCQHACFQLCERPQEVRTDYSSLSVCSARAHVRDYAARLYRNVC